MNKGLIVISSVLIIGIGFYFGYKQAKKTALKQWTKNSNVTQVSYDTWIFTASKLSSSIMENVKVSKQDITKMMGIPLTVSTGNTYMEEWDYKIQDPEHPQYYDITVGFDRAGKMRQIITRHKMIDPATVSLTISQTYWKRNIISQGDPKYFNAKNMQYQIMVEARQGLSGYVFTGPNEQVTQIDRHYTRQLFPGTYNLYLVVMEKQGEWNYRYVYKIPLSENLRLGKNETRKIRL